MAILKALILDDLIDFLSFWFLHFPKKILRHYFDSIYSFEYFFKVKSNLRNIAKPLYGDYTLIGYFIAFPYRFIRIFIGLVFYLFVFIFYIIFLLIWVLLPLILIYGVLFSK